MLIILFGLAGSGKNFVANILQHHFNYFFWDADDALTIDMTQSIINKKSFTQTMRDKLTQRIIHKITSLATQHPNLVITQALYKEKNRLTISQQFPQAIFILVKANQDVIGQRLQSRGDLISDSYAQHIAANFEEPSLPHQIIINDSDQAHVIEQIHQIMNSQPNNRDNPVMGES